MAFTSDRWRAGIAESFVMRWCSKSSVGADSVGYDALVSEPEVPDSRVDQFIVYAGYGEVMHQFQVFELTLWGFLTRSIKAGMSAEQVDEKVEKWDGTTFGKVIRGLKSQTHWPAGMVDDLEEAVATRNYFAHHFLREYFVVTPSDEVRDQAAVQLANVSTRLERLEQAVEAHLRSLGVVTIDDLDEDVVKEIEALRPTAWLDESTD